MVLSAILSIIIIDVTVGRMSSGIPSTFQSVPQIYSVQISYFWTFEIQNKTCFLLVLSKDNLKTKTSPTESVKLLYENCKMFFFSIECK